MLRELFAIQFVEQRFVIEQVHLRRRAALEQIDDTLGFGGEVRKTGESTSRVLILDAKQGLWKQAREADDPQATGRPGEELAARDRERVGQRVGREVHHGIMWIFEAWETIQEPGSSEGPGSWH